MNHVMDLSKLNSDGVIIRIKNTHTIMIRSVVDAFHAKAHIPEKISIIAVDALQQGAKFVRIESINNIRPALMEDAEIWHAITEDNNFYATQRLG